MSACKLNEWKYLLVSLSVWPDVLKSACVFKGGKAQIISPEEEDEEDDGYAFNEVYFRCLFYAIFSLFNGCISPFPPLIVSRRWMAHSRTLSC